MSFPVLQLKTPAPIESVADYADDPKQVVVLQELISRLVLNRDSDIQTLEAVWNAALSSVVPEEGTVATSKDVEEQVGLSMLLT